ncbi:MAG TPA: IS5 family transposase [Candidatus Angelobacter sp.]|nr:IS5 family transposase [Candidatus Angelobacter sp.]HJY49951.1 IS5 family transposase [Stellaceae bacterium]
MTDDEWAYFEPFLIHRGGGRPPRNHRRVLDAVFWLMRTGAPWRDLPEGFGNWNSIFRQFRRWADSGVWDVILEGLAGSGVSDAALQMIDATIIRAHHCAAGGKGGPERNALGRSRGGFSTKINARTNAEGLPIGVVITPGQAHDVTAFPALMQEIDCDPEQMLGDKGYDSEAVRNDIEERGGEAAIPSTATRKIQHAVDKALYALRNRIERFFNRAKNSRRVATRYDKLIESFAAFVLLACIRIWIKFVHTT